MSYPIDTIRRRMMMTSGQAVKYNGSLDCATQVPHLFIFSLTIVCFSGMCPAKNIEGGIEVLCSKFGARS